MAATIRPATPADRPALEIVRRQAIEDVFAGRYDRAAYADRVATEDERLPTWLSTDSYRTLVVETPITPAAFAVLELRPHELCALYTAPDYAGNGHATDLLGAIGDADRAMTVTAPEPAVGFFRSRGFERIGSGKDGPIPTVRLRRSADG